MRRKRKFPSDNKSNKPSNSQKNTSAPKIRKPGPNGKLNKKQKLLVEQYCHLPHEKNSRYIAYMKAGYRGSKILCDDIFETAKIKNAISNYKSDKRIIDDPETRANKKNAGSMSGHTLSKLNEDIMVKIETHIGMGMSYRNVSALVGIAPVTFHSWVRKGKEDIENQDFDSDYTSFYYRLKKAHSKGEAELLGCLYDAAYGRSTTETKNETNTDGETKTIEIVRRQWQAAAWLLERTRPKLYSKMAIELEDTESMSSEEMAEQTLSMLNSMISMQKKDKQWF